MMKDTKNRQSVTKKVYENQRDRFLIPSHAFSLLSVVNHRVGEFDPFSYSFT